MSILDRLRSSPAALDGDEEPNDPELHQLLERTRALPRETQPERDLWLGIENRTRQPRQTTTANAGLRGLFPRPVLAAATGLALVAITATLTLWASDRSVTLPTGDPETRALADSVRSRDGVSDVHERLVALLESRGSELPTGTVLALGENLQVIDRAIADIHRALLEHPDDEALKMLLADAHRSELELLESLEWWLAPGSGRS